MPSKRQIVANGGCKAKTKAGRQCAARPIKGGQMCSLHADPDRAAQLGRQGGRRNRRLYKTDGKKVATPKSACDAASVDSEKLRRAIADPLFWLRNCTNTKDPHWKETGESAPYRRFPDKPYFRPVISAIKEEDVLFIPKSRDMMLSWLVVGFFAHLNMTVPGLETLMQSQTEEKAAELIDYAKCLYDQQEAELKRAFPLATPLHKQNWLEFEFGNGSRMVGIPHGADKIRSYHPTALVIDEAAFVAEAGESYDVAISACKKIVVVSSAAPGWFETVCVSVDNHCETIKGVSEGRTPQDMKVIRVHYSADPEKATQEWKKKERAKYTMESKWQSEQEIVFGAGGGERLFAEILYRWGDKIIIDPEESGFEVPSSWEMLGGFDHGKANPTAALVAAVDFDGNIYILREYYQPGLSPRQNAPYLAQLDGFLDTTMFADPSIFKQTQAQQDGTFKAIDELYREYGVENMVAAPENNELLGMERILHHWVDLENREPTLKILCPKRFRDIQKPLYGIHNEGCPNLLWELRRARRAELSATQLLDKNPTEKIVDKDNHLRDCLKYLVLTFPEPAEKPIQMRAAEAIKPLVEQRDLTSALIHYNRLVELETLPPPQRRQSRRR